MATDETAATGGAVTGQGIEWHPREEEFLARQSEPFRREIYDLRQGMIRTAANSPATGSEHHDGEFSAVTASDVIVNKYVGKGVNNGEAREWLRHDEEKIDKALEPSSLAERLQKLLDRTSSSGRDPFS